MMTLNIEKIGRRYYIRGNTYPIKDKLRSAGCRWDRDQRAWWTGKSTVAQELMETSSGSTPSREERETIALSSRCIAGRATYKGRTYYLVGRVRRGRTTWDDTTELVVSRTDKYKLVSRDGQLVFWAARPAVEVRSTYQRLRSIQGLKDYARKAPENGGYIPRKGVDYCGYPCPVDGHRCTADSPCHDCM